MAGIRDHEDSIREKMLERLHAHEQLAAVSFALMSRAQTIPDHVVGPQQLSLMAMRPLLARLQGDLRAIYLLAIRGYALAALSLAASLHEIAFITMYIGGNDSRARDWFAHSNPYRTYPPITVKQIIEDVGQQLGLTAERIQQEYSVYQQLCEAKHGNPRLQTRYGIVAFDEHQVIEQIPFYSDNTVVLCGVALWFASRALTLATMVFVNEHLPEAEREEIGRALDAHLEALNARGAVDGLVRREEAQ